MIHYAAGGKLWSGPDPGAGAVTRHYHDDSVEDNELPLITKEDMSKKFRDQIQKTEQGILKNRDLWIVVDNIVYDCSDFVTEHPGGEQVIRSFAGEDCSWQFWRFHGSKEMIEYGRPLRIGRTHDVPNRFIEIPRYIGLSRSNHDDW